MTRIGLGVLPGARAELVIFFLDGSEQSLQPISLLEVTQLGRIGRAHVECKEVAIGIELVECGDEIRHCVLGFNDFASTDVDSERNLERRSVSPECSKPLGDGRRPFVIEPQSIDKRFVFRQTVKPRFGIARLRQCRYSPDL